MPFTIPYDVNVSHVVTRNNISPEIFEGEIGDCPAIALYEEQNKARALITALGPFKAAFLTGISEEEIDIIKKDVRDYRVKDLKVESSSTAYEIFYDFWDKTYLL